MKKDNAFSDNDIARLFADERAQPGAELDASVLAMADNAVRDNPSPAQVTPPHWTRKVTPWFATAAVLLLSVLLVPMVLENNTATDFDTSLLDSHDTSLPAEVTPGTENAPTSVLSPGVATTAPKTSSGALFREKKAEQAESLNAANRSDDSTLQEEASRQASEQRRKQSVQEKAGEAPADLQYSPVSPAPEVDARAVQPLSQENLTESVPILDMSELESLVENNMTAEGEDDTTVPEHIRPILDAMRKQHWDVARRKLDAFRQSDPDHPMVGILENSIQALAGR